MSLSTRDKLRLRNLWKGESTDEEICEILQVSLEQLAAYVKAMGLPERHLPEVYLPSPEEIRIACAVLREGWTQEQREARLRASPRVILEGEAGNAGDSDTAD